MLADGELMDCDEHRHPDLFWALRGAGTGSFGIVVSLSLRTVPVPVQTWNRHLTWPAAEAEAVAGAWQHWAPWLPGEIAASLKVTVVVST